MENKVKKKGLKVYIPIILVVGIVLGVSIYWYKDYSKYITTDDAHVDADNVAISPKMLSRIAKLYAEEGDAVKIGCLLAELDSTDLLAQKMQAIASKEQANAAQMQSEAKYEYDKENIKVLEINLAKTKEDFDRATNQIAGEVIAKEQFEHIQKSYETAKAQLDAAKTQLKVSIAQINSAMAAVESSKAQVGVITTALKNTILYAPMDGVVAKRWLLPGDIAQPGQSIFTVTESSKLWVTIFLEETKVSELHMGQNTIISLDAFPDVKFTGKIFSLGSNTASQFSLIPANNASGNFTKVTQRISFKISIDGTQDGKSASSYKILPGMSAVVKIIKD